MLRFRHPPRQISTPGGNRPAIYADMTKQAHLLIAGKTGAGKSVVINGIIYSLLCELFPSECSLILIDPKRVELAQWRDCPHCIEYASEPGEPAKALQTALDITEDRYRQMQRERVKRYQGGAVYVIIDELADLMTVARRDVLPLLQRLCQIGRAANVHVIAATQCPLTKVIPTEVKVNFDAVLGLKTVTRQHSRNIIEEGGCELLPPYGFGYYRTPAGLTVERLPMIPEPELDRVAAHWNRQTA